MKSEAVNVTSQRAPISELNYSLISIFMLGYDIHTFILYAVQRVHIYDDDLLHFHMFIQSADDFVKCKWICISVILFIFINFPVMARCRNKAYA